MDKVTVVTRINDVNIIVLEGGEKMVPIKPICEALGISYPSQYAKIQEDPILSSTVVLSTTVATDGKEREMVSIPFRYVFGWLFRIDSRNVKEEARESVLRYQVLCYDALYNSLFSYVNYVEFRAQRISQELEKLKQARFDFSIAKSTMYEAENRFREVQKLTFEEYLAETAQLSLIPEEGGEDA